jgi:8-oxo-dGTP pyrophosphatase MutT (NUDIX family)
MPQEHVEEINPGPPTRPRPAAAVILLRRGGRHDSRGLQVLLGKRTSQARFMAGVWVFPGGAVDGGETDDNALRSTALRELAEEVGVEIGSAEALVPFSRWITPVEVKVRYDTFFYLACAPPHCSPRPDGEEIVDAGWFAPSDALERHQQGDLLLVFPTIKQLEALSRFASAEEALQHAAKQDPEPILPRIDVADGEPRVLLPGDPGY